jgi:HPt (histidine-containing phosphotransfer) domain-containing protein
MRTQTGLRAQGSGLILLMAAVSACAPAPATNKTPAAGTAMSRAIIDPYLKIQAALADDSMEGVKANAGNIATAATALGAPAMKIDTTAVQLASAAELEDARDKFGALSEAIDTYMTGLHLTTPEGVKVAVCPMVNKPWLQAEADIRNPYFGKDMLTCGSFR